MYRVLTMKKIEKHREELEKLNPNIRVEESDKIFMISSEEGKIRGYAILGKDRILKDIFINKEDRYHSYGIKLGEFIKNYLSDKGINEIFLDKYHENPRFFKRLGFQEWSGGMYKVDGLEAKKQRKKDGINSTLWSILINIILAFIKIFFGTIGKSKALIADGFHSVSDIVSSIVVLIGIYLGNKPADEEHPYGHGKLESIAGNIIGVILIITAYTLILENIEDYFKGATRSIPGNITIVIALISIVVKYVLYKYKYNIGKKIKSDAVLADAREHKTDVLSSVAVLLGILLSIYVNPVFDLLLSIIVGVIIGKEGLHIIFDTSNNLMDIQDKGLVADIKKYVDSFKEIENTHDIRMTTSGNMIFLILHIRLDGNLSIYQGHEISDDVKYSLLNRFDNLEEVTIHIDCTI